MVSSTFTLFSLLLILFPAGLRGITNVGLKHLCSSTVLSTLNLSGTLHFLHHVCLGWCGELQFFSVKEKTVALTVEAAVDMNKVDFFFDWGLPIFLEVFFRMCLRACHLGNLLSCLCTDGFLTLDNACIALATPKKT